MVLEDGCLWAQAVIAASQMWLYSSRALLTPPSVSLSVFLPLFHATSFSVAPHVSWEGVTHTTEDRLQGSVLAHYFAGCCSVMSGKCGGPRLFITGSVWVVAIFYLARWMQHRRQSTPPMALTAGCSSGLAFVSEAILCCNNFFLYPCMISTCQKGCVSR